MVLRVGELYPVADEELSAVPGDWERKAARVRATGEYRAPKAGEWWLSGAIVEGYHSPYDLRDPQHIGVLVRGETVTMWREVK